LLTDTVTGEQQITQSLFVSGQETEE
jgi:hypothetical protein